MYPQEGESFITVYYNKNGFEFALGPLIELSQTSQGYYNNNHEWIRLSDPENIYSEYDNPYDIIERMDSRGEPKIATSWVWAIGKTFKSGYLNMPVNIYFSQKTRGWIVGASIGFNVSKY